MDKQRKLDSKETSIKCTALDGLIRAGVEV